MLKRTKSSFSKQRVYRALMPFLLFAACVLVDIGASAAP